MKNLLALAITLAFTAGALAQAPTPAPKAAAPTGSTMDAGKMNADKPAVDESAPATGKDKKKKKKKGAGAPAAH